jgi:putative ABC transport system permease protein
MLSLRNTFRRRMRLALTLLPLALSGTLVISVINVRSALQGELANIMAYRKYDFDISFEQPYLFASVQNTALSIPGVTQVEGYQETSDAYRLRADGSQGSYVSALGVSPDSRMIRLPVMDGRWLQPADQAVVVVNDTFQRDEPDIQIDDHILLRIDGRKVETLVVGLVREKMAPPRLYLNDAYFARMFGNAGKPNNIWLLTDGQGDPTDFKKALNVQFEQANLHIASVTPVSDQRDSIDFHFSIMMVPLGMAAFLLALVGGLGLMGAMSTNVIERQREIGVMRAIGAPDRGVRRLFIVEGLIVGLLSWLLSFAAAWPISHLLDQAIGSAFLKSPLADVYPASGAVAWLVIVVITSVVSCYVPAQNAAQTSVRNLLAYQ